MSAKLTAEQKAANAAYMRQYRLDHPEYRAKFSDYHARWVAAHPEAARESVRTAGRKFDAAHREERSRASHERRLRNPEKARAQAAQYRAKMDPHEVSAKAAVWRALNPEYNRQWESAHREQRRATTREWYRLHPELRALRNHRRRETRKAVPPYPRMDPWPTDCQCCHEEIDTTLPRRSSRGASEGHEPPLIWAARHPEYEGTYILRPEHFGCNSRKGSRPDWERA